MLTEAAAEPREQQTASRATMKAAVFVAPGRIELQDRPIPKVGPTDVLLRVTTTTICGTDVHILKGEHSSRIDTSSIRSRKPTICARINETVF